MLDLKNLILLDVSGNENLTCPPLDICAQGVKQTMEYLEIVPVTVDDMQEGWELIDPTLEDLEQEFGMSTYDIAPHLTSFNSDYSDNIETPNTPEQEKKSPGWVSWSLGLLSRSFLGE